ncbi:hypothetical protein Kfla_2072 [Kribbella flavida DSM 17836]|uniref:Uncharacterized protein n=1 Tax=Kribbella flavida (strain DSM 17836 / JCM 10339 / NBRC 14399) TaxID=479435 RepID=D2PS30_KRIFD|nr:hypothetical protein Kfla_2072 [Kribbella flavida DSM 17836]
MSCIRCGSSSLPCDSSLRARVTHSRAGHQPIAAPRAAQASSAAFQLRGPSYSPSGGLSQGSGLSSPLIWWPSVVQPLKGPLGSRSGSCGGRRGRATTRSSRCLVRGAVLPRSATARRVGRRLRGASTTAGTRCRARRPLAGRPRSGTARRTRAGSRSTAAAWSAAAESSAPAAEASASSSSWSASSSRSAAATAAVMPGTPGAETSMAPSSTAAIWASAALFSRAVRRRFAAATRSAWSTSSPATLP